MVCSPRCGVEPLRAISNHEYRIRVPRVAGLNLALGQNYYHYVISVPRVAGLNPDAVAVDGRFYRVFPALRG